MADKTFFLDGIGPLDQGINSGYDAHLLPSNQFSFATNATFRGAYVGPRPGFRRIAVDYTSDALRLAITKGNWQGGTPYNGDDGSGSLVVAIAGRLFQFFPDPQGASTATVFERTIPGDPNPPTPLMAWLEQAENYVIWNDGQSIPVFFDGTTSRRSLSTQVSYGQVALAFTAPAIGSTVNVTLNAPFTGPPNSVMIIDGAIYQITTGSGGFPASLTELFTSAATVYPIGTQVIINPNVFGVQATTINFANTGTTYGPNGTNMTLVFTQPLTVPDLGAFATIFGKKWQVVSFNLFTNTVLFQNKETVTMPANIQAGTQILKWNSNVPNSLVGSTVAVYTSPGNGNTSQVLLDQLYSGAAGQVVFLNNDEYTIAPVAVTPPGGVVVTLINVTDTAGTVHDPVLTPNIFLLSVPELPPGRNLTYGLGQVKEALIDGLQFIYSDIVGGSSGTQANNYRDAVLRTVQSTSVGGLGNFRVPGSVGKICWMTHVAMLDVSLGQGPLTIATELCIFSCRAPITTDILATITTPILTESLKGNGGTGQNDFCLVNGDIIFGGNDNSIRSYTLSRLDFNKWSTAPISREMSRIIALNNKSLLQYGTEVNFNNRALKSQLPTNGPLGVYHQGLAVLNFDPLSSIRGKAPSIWDGFWTGLNIFQMLTGMVNGTERCYAFCFNAVTVEIELWEILSDTDTSFDNDTIPITWSGESAALFNNVRGKAPFDLVELLDGEIYLKDIRGIVNVQTWYKPDYSECWTPWHAFTICASNTALSDPKQFRTRLGLGEPNVMACEPTNDRPYRIGNTFQFRIQITGSCKFMGAQFMAAPFPETKFSVPICDPLCSTVTDPNLPCEPCKIQSPCLRFDPVFYNLNAGKSYSNALLSFNVVCPDNTTQVVTIQPGTINFTLPFPIPFDGVYPPLVLGCVGGNIVRELPAGSTQEQADAIIEAMILECAQATANATVVCPDPVVIASCDGTDTNQYMLSLYVDGDVINNVGDAPVGGEVVFDGNFPFKSGSNNCRWMATFFEGPDLLVNTLQMCDVYVLFLTDRWILRFVAAGPSIVWEGEKLVGSTPAGVYINNGVGVDAVLPASLTIVLGVGSTTNQSQLTCSVS